MPVPESGSGGGHVCVPLCASVCVRVCVCGSVDSCTASPIGNVSLMGETRGCLCGVSRGGGGGAGHQLLVCVFFFLGGEGRYVCACVNVGDRVCVCACVRASTDVQVSLCQCALSS